MSHMMTLSASEFFKNIKNYHRNIDDEFEQPSMIVPKLRAHQRQTIKWMIEKENDNNLVKSDGSPFGGGILADEMGLGKTLEMLSCIMANIPPSEFYDKKIEVSKNDIQNTSKPIKPKPSTSKCVVNEDFFVECYCISAPPRKTLVICAMCGKKQHAECVNFRPKPFQEVPYLCAHCWTLNDKMPCKATLILVPQSILNQWIVEIEKHIAKPGLKVFIYKGVHLDGYIQPISFNDYDIVITSYNILSKDIKYVENYALFRVIAARLSLQPVSNTNVPLLFSSLKVLKNQNTSRLRHSKKYNYPPSPLPCIKWWRICLDEYQAAESGKNKVSEMTLCLKSVHKWAITGTPVQKSLYDLYDILKFLDVSPFNDHEQFLRLLENDTNFVFEWFAKVIWRNSVEDVKLELKLPQLTTEKHWLTFSEIEKYFYISQHNIYANQFSNAVNRQTPGILLKHIDGQILNTILEPLYKLQQASILPQAIYGEFSSVKGTMTMDKLIDVMMEKCRVECNNKLFSLIHNHNEIAFLYLFCHEPASAVELYRNVLHLMDLYKNKNLKINMFQKMITLYHLSEVLDKYTTISSELINSDFKNKAKLLEKQYFDGHKKNIESTQKIVQTYTDEIANLIGKKTLNYSNWWSNILEWIISPRDFLIEVLTELEDYHVPGVPNIANRLKSVNDVFNILNVWLTKLDSARTEVISTLKKLGKTPMKVFGCSALVHSSQSLLFKAQSQLQLLESLLMGKSYTNLNTLADKIVEKSDEVTMYESLCEGVGKMSQKEFLLMKVFQYGQAKIVNNKCLKDAAKHMKILDLIRKEFGYLRLLWAYHNNSLTDHFKIIMIKEKLQLCFKKSLQPETDNENDPPKKKTKRDKKNDVLKLKDFTKVLESSLPTVRAELEKKTGTLLYLENLKKKGNTIETEPCPICTLNVDSEWAVLLCGHSVCDKCMATMCSHSRDLIIACPICRDETPIYSMSYVKNNEESEVSGIVLQGSFSTKIEKITAKLLELITQDPNVKVLVYSIWKKTLEHLEEALELNLINYRILKSGNKYKKTLVDFKTNTKINVLLMNLSLNAKGLTFTEATHVFFMEPIINKAEEHQAIDRVHRIGQTKPTFVHHFIIRDSIEEIITNLFSGELWDDMTVSQMATIFERTQPNPHV